MPYGIELVTFESSSESLEALRAGAIDVSHFVQPSNLVLAQGNAEEPWTADSAPIAIVAVWSNPDHPGFSLVVRDPAFGSFSDLQGKKVAFSKGTVGHVYFEWMLEESGLSNIEPVQLPAPEGRSAYLSGSVDAIITAYRTAVALEQQGEGWIIDSSQRLMDYYQVSAVQRTLLEDVAKVSMIKDLIERSDRAAEWAQSHVEELVAFNVGRGILDQASAELIAQYEPRRSAPLKGDFSTWMTRVSEVLFRAGVIASDVDTSVLFDQTFSTNLLQGP